MDKLQLTIEFENTDHLRDEFERNLSNGGAFIRNAEGARSGDRCEVVLVHPGNGETKTIACTVALVVDQGENKGIGVAFDDFGMAMRETLRQFIEDNDASEQETPGRLRDKVRYMSETQRLNIAREGDAGERMALERRYGKLVWEILLRSPKITRMEVANIAKKGALPQNLRQLILTNKGWLADRQVRKGLLSNPRMSDAEISSVLRASPKDELKLLSKQASTAPKIRKAAMNILMGF